MDCEVVIAEYAVRGRAMVQAMVESAPPDVKVLVTSRWERRAPTLMMYGLGNAARQQWAKEHAQAGGRLIGWDLGYWDRKPDGGMRLTIDANHPHRLIRPMPSERWDARKVPLREDCDPGGPIVLVGLGPKSRAMMGHGRMQWERAALDRIKTYGKQITYRPKKDGEDCMPGCTLGVGDIAQVIRGASLVVCAHSNVAVDACIAGIPVECEDGAAFALYGKHKNPTREQRLEFLRSLAWWNWKPEEASEAWGFIRTQLSRSTAGVEGRS